MAAKNKTVFSATYGAAQKTIYGEIFPLWGTF
jgi:hypothetical protein